MRRRADLALESAAREFGEQRDDFLDRAVLVYQGRSDNSDPLSELRQLAESAGVEVVAEIISRRESPNPATFIGSGKVEQIKDEVVLSEASLVVINHAITPLQERNLERTLECRVLDRTRLILDIFAQRAATHEGKLQVELAQLRYLSTRLVRGWSHLERQKGGIGLRGPGETQLETDRRLIGKRISTLVRRLERIRRQRELRRRSRRKVPVPTISLVGYTNAGKSTLFNRLTEANAFVADQVFATLDPTMRRIDIEGFGEAIISDTVGFIRDLPHGLVSAFHATLEEVSHADLLIHVVDATDPDRGEMMAAVNQVLDEIDANQIPTIMVYNKIDLGERASDIEQGREGRIQKVWLSAVSGEGIPLLLQGIADHLGSDRRHFRLRLPVSASRLRASLYRRGSVVTEAFTDEGEFLLELNLDSGDIGWLEQQEELNSGSTLESIAATTQG